MPPIKKAKQQAKPRKAAVVKNVPEKAVVSGQLKKKIDKQQKIVKQERGVVFIKHLPHGFFEEQLKKYFEQFGRVTRLRLARSKRTGGSKGFAFVEFAVPEVAQVAAETMDNYLMFKKIVKAAYIPPEKQQFNYFKTSVRKIQNKVGKEIYISGKSMALQRKLKQQNDWSDDAYNKRTVAKLRKIEKLKAKYADLGIDFNNIIVGPNKLSEEEANSKQAKAQEDKVEASNSKKKMVGKPRASAESTKPKKGKKTVELRDLMESTIDDDTEDDDFIPMAPSDDEVTSDEETYGFEKKTDSESEGSDDEENDAQLNSKAKLTKGPAKVNRFDQLIKRKANAGGVQKPAKKAPKKPVTGKAKATLQKVAAKEIVKTLPAVPTKLNIKAKAGKKKKM